MLIWSGTAPLVERCQAGDSAAFGNLYARYYERLLRFCLRRLNDRHEAEDAAQEAFARAWKALPRFAGERRFYPWLTVIAGNICTDMLRRRSRSTPTDDMELTAQHPVGVVGEDTSEELVLAAVDGELVNRALDRLSTRHRHVLAMREGSGWTYQQIADHEGVEIGTIETLLWRARQALKREFAAVSESEGGTGRFPHRHGQRSFAAPSSGPPTAAPACTSSGNGSAGAAQRVHRRWPSPARPSPPPSSRRTLCRVDRAAPHRHRAPPWRRLPSRWDRRSPSQRGGSSLAGPEALAAGAVGRRFGDRRRIIRVPPGAARSATAPPARTSSGGGGGGGGGDGGGGSGGPKGSGGGSLLGGVLPGGGTSPGSAGLTGGLNQAAGGLGDTVNGVTDSLGQTVSGVTSGLGQTVEWRDRSVG